MNLQLSYDIIDRIKKGDKDAFKVVFEENFNPLCAFGSRYTGDSSAVEDLIQEVFINFWEIRQKFNHINAVKAFLYTSVRNKCLNLLKHKTVHQKHESALIYELESDHLFSNQVIEEETFNQLYTEIRNLPEAAQKIMLLALKGLKNKEIADELSVSENTIKTQKKIAYAKLKNRLSPVLRGVFLSL